jgi:hypothetical protein
MDLSLLPPLASVVLLVFLWTELAHPRVVASCLAVGIVLQFVAGAPFNAVWLAGLLLNVVVGVCLAIRLKMAKMP